MPKLVPIVEGDGETTAVPVLLNMLLKATQCYHVQVAIPKNANGQGNLTKPGGLEKFLTHASNERDCGAIVILLDVEEGCPLELVRDFAERTEKHYVPCPVVIVAANKMYENWILASLETVRGKPLDDREGLPTDAPLPVDAEAEHGKDYINNCFPLVGGYRRRGYKETLDQEAMTRHIDSTLAKANSRSFRRLCHAVEEAVQMIDAKQSNFSPNLALVTAALEISATVENRAPKRKGKKP